MKRRMLIVLGVVVLFLVLVGATLWKQARPVEEAQGLDYDYATVKDLATTMEVNKTETWENRKGELDAPVVIYEYADFQCGHCAEINAYINKIVEEYQGKVALVFRTYVLPYSNNGVEAAAAVNAAAKQGYWSEMKDILFERQVEWYGLRKDRLWERLGEYFMIASEGRGNKKEFFDEAESEEVKQKIAQDMAQGMAAGLTGTPWFLINGELVRNEGVSASRYATQLRERINEELKALPSEP